MTGTKNVQISEENGLVPPQNKLLYAAKSMKPLLLL